MNAKTAVTEVIEDRQITRAYLAQKLGYSTISAVTERLKASSKNDMRVDTLVKFLEAMDCTLVIRSNLKDKKEWVITA